MLQRGTEFFTYATLTFNRTIKYKVSDSADNTESNCICYDFFESKDTSSSRRWISSTGLDITEPLISLWLTLCGGLTLEYKEGVLGLVLCDDTAACCE